MPKAGSTHARGYGYTHVARRRWWKKQVDEGQATCQAIICLMPTRSITPGTPWDLDHTDDRTAYRGPAHRRCNRAAGARQGNSRRRHPQELPHSQDW